MQRMVGRCRTWLGSAVVFSLLASLGWIGGDALVRGTAVPPAAPVPEQAGRAAGGVFDAEAEHERQRAAHDWLTAEQPVAAAERPLAIQLTTDDLAQLGVSEDGSRKLRVGTVKALNARVRFEDLNPADLQGRRVREHGVLQGTADGGLVWTAAVRSAGAAALRLRIDAVFLPPRSELWIYTAAGEAHGPYTAAGPHGTREFWTHSVAGSEAFLQLRKRGPVTPGDLKRLGFVIADVAHIDDAALRGGSGPDASAAAGFCAFNANCVVGGECAGGQWDTVRNAAAHIRFVSGPFVYMCSGGLVADSSASGIPYFLTANHCVSRGREASSLEAYFQFRSPSCGSTTGCSGPSSSVPRTLGSTILATNKTGDYTLLRLSGSLPAGAHLLGWTATPIANTNDAQLFRISHPGGSPQAYSEHRVDTSKPTCSSWPRGSWIYSRDTLGATEGGSSGSPVVNAQGQIVGQLSGACGFNVNDSCDSAANATVDGAFASYYSAVAPYLGPVSSNQPPTASFVYSCAGLECSFDGSDSDDTDGAIASYAWTLGDNTTRSGPVVSHTYVAGGTYSVRLTVTDDDGATASSTQAVTVSAGEPPPGAEEITLTATGYKEKGLQKADLTWSGATSAQVDVRRSGVTRATVANSGAYTDHIDQRGGGSYVYEVCEAGTATCSSPVTVTF